MKYTYFMVHFSLSGPEDVEDDQWFYDCKPKWIGASDIATPNGTNEIEQFYEIRFKIYCYIQAQSLFDEKMLLKKYLCEIFFEPKWSRKMSPHLFEQLAF